MVSKEVQVLRLCCPAYPVHSQVSGERSAVAGHLEFGVCGVPPVCGEREPKAREPAGRSQPVFKRGGAVYLMQISVTEIPPWPAPQAPEGECTSHTRPPGKMGKPFSGEGKDGRSRPGWCVPGGMRERPAGGL